MNLNYTYDANGRVTVINAVANNAWDRTFTYDGAGRLKTAAGPWGSGSYLYDPLSNLTKKSLGSRVVDIETNSLNRVYRVKDTAVSATWRTYTHDARGNVTNDGIHGFTYDFANQPTAISGADTGTYSYDGMCFLLKLRFPESTRDTMDLEPISGRSAVPRPC